MAGPIGGAVDGARAVLANLRETLGGTLGGERTLRLGVTGLSRAGKTVFIAALVHALTEGGALPAFRAHSGGRITRVRLAPQPDADVPRFQVEEHIDAIARERRWPSSTRAIAQVRLVVEYEDRRGRARRLALDIVDYPGEWLLDLPLLTMDFRAFSREASELSALPLRAPLAAEWLALARSLDPTRPADETRIEALHAAYARYLRRCREEERALSSLPPGRFLMPGDLDGSPAMTFAPLPDLPERAPRGSLAATMAARYEAYLDVVVRPFFRDHFARLDRQVVLVDVLQALNAGPESVADLRRALGGILSGFHTGRLNPLARVFARRIDRVVLCATKADHLHRDDHDRLEAVVAALAADAFDARGAREVGLARAALAAVRATREARGEGPDPLPLIVGTPMEGERIDGRSFDGTTQTAIFPGDLPRDPRAVLREDLSGSIRFVRFRPPALERGPDGALRMPHIRLDRVLEHVLGDRLE